MVFTRNTIGQMRKIVQATEPVTYFPPAAPSGYGTGIAVANAWRRTITKEDMLANQSLIGQTGVAWLMEAGQLGSTVPIPDGKVTDATGQAWLIRQVEILDLQGFFRCLCTLAN